MCNQVSHVIARRAGKCGSSFLALLLVMIVHRTIANVACAQSLNWEGQTGVFVTPLAYLVPSQDHGFGRPVVAYHLFKRRPSSGRISSGIGNGGSIQPARVWLHAKFP